MFDEGSFLHFPQKISYYNLLSFFDKRNKSPFFLSIQGRQFNTPGNKVSVFAPYNVQGPLNSIINGAHQTRPQLNTQGLSD